MRRKMIFLPILACSDKEANTAAKESEQVTQTRMNEIDNLEGTISDEMIVTDDASDEAELESVSDASADAPKTLPGKPVAKLAAPKPEDDAGETSEAAE
jgi:hypothetical protein